MLSLIDMGVFRGFQDGLMDMRLDLTMRPRQQICNSSQSRMHKYIAFGEGFYRKVASQDDL